MLVLTRKAQQKIKVGDDITITVIRIKGQQVRIGIEAPRDIRVMRGELAEPQPELIDAADTQSECEAVAEEEMPAEASEFHELADTGEPPVDEFGEGPLSSRLRKRQASELLCVS